MCRCVNAMCNVYLGMFSLIILCQYMKLQLPLLLQGCCMWQIWQLKCQNVMNIKCVFFQLLSTRLHFGYSQIYLDKYILTLFVRNSWENVWCSAHSMLIGVRLVKHSICSCIISSVSTPLTRPFYLSFQHCVIGCVPGDLCISLSIYTGVTSGLPMPVFIKRIQTL